MARIARTLTAVPAFFAGLAASYTPDQRLIVQNLCTTEDVWIASSSNVPGDRNVRIPPGQSHAFSIPLTGLKSTRFWPKMFCNSVGGQCRLGSSGGPGQDCPAEGCAPPVDSKFEASFGCVGGACPATASGTDKLDWWDTSAVDGYTLPYKVSVDATCPQGVEVDCSALTLSDCPSESLASVGSADLKLRSPENQQVVGCYSPCGKLTYSNWNNPIGGHSPADPLAAPYCCPTPPVSADQCRTGPVISTGFVNLIHQKCKSVYAYAYDDGVGLQTCPAGTRFTWSIMCPNQASKAAEELVV